LEKVLLIAEGEKVDVGTPYLKGASVTATVIAQTKGEKTISFKYRKRKSSHWNKGHRQQLTQVKITKIAA